jgi:hypothetical protein
MNIPGGGGLRRQLLKQMEKMQQEMAAAQEALAAARVEASSGGGAVTAIVDGSGELVDLRISAEVVDPSDPEMLRDLLVAAVREAQEKASRLREEKLGGLAGGLGLGDLL